MKVNKIPLLNTGYFSGLTKAYLCKDDKLSSFYNHYFDLNNFDAAIEERQNFEIDRNSLHQVLQKQHQSFFNAFSHLESSIELIKDKNTFTITTGHQICLATGPLYFIYKIASAINLSRKLKEKYPQYNFIPVYWMATEDHDFSEINHIHLFNKKISWDKETADATGRITTNGIETFLNEIKDILGEKAGSVNYFETVVAAYNNQTNLANATRDLVLHLFGDQGIVVLDADDAQLKSRFKEIIKNDIIGQVSHKAVSNTIEHLVKANLIKEEKIQVKPRPINFFYLKDGYRKRITSTENSYHVLDTEITFTEKELLNEIDQFPERFSPNVIMRPVYQECILPNLVYIGGAGELSYWFELKACFDAHQTFFPMLALRNSFLWIDLKQAEKLNQLGISIAEIFNNVDDLTLAYLKRIGVDETNFDSELNELNQIIDQIKIKVTNIEATLSATVEGERQKLQKSIEILVQKTAKAQKQKHDISINQIKKLKENLFPEGGLQERYENILWLNMKFGNEIINQLINHANTEAQEIVIFTA